MAVTVPQSSTRRAAHLRLVQDVRRSVQDARRSILIAGGDAGRRSALLAELARRLPAGTSFQEAGATWEMLERAPSSRMVMIAGELDGASTESVIHLLGSRHPQLPVVALSAPGADC